MSVRERHGLALRRLTLLVPNNLGSSLAFKAPSPKVGRVAVNVMIFPPIVPCTNPDDHQYLDSAVPRRRLPGLTINL